jgi:hypothetical protein
LGAGGDGSIVASGQVWLVIGCADHRTAYAAAVPVAPSSPGAVHCSVIAESLETTAVRSAISAGAVVSAGGGFDPLSLQAVTAETRTSNGQSVLCIGASS